MTFNEIYIFGLQMQSGIIHSENQGFLLKLKWNHQQSPDLITNDGFEMARLWDFQKYPIFGNLSDYYLFCKVLLGGP